jgi:CDP-glucose 4,6-dehydratase
MMERAFWRGRRTLITGATGLLGSWLLKRLIVEGAEPVALVRDDVPGSLASQQGALAKCTAVVHGRLEDFGCLRRTLSEYSIETIFHLGAQTLVGVSKVDPLTTLETNVRGTWNVMEAARLCGTPQVIVASSDKAYGPSERLPYTEDHPLEGRYPYDVSKSCADLIARMYAATYNVPVVVIRCANLFGGGDMHFSRIIPGAIRATLRGDRFVIRSNGMFIRDYLYVEDGVSAYLRVAEELAGRHSLSGEAFNFGLGMRVTVLELVAGILNAMGRPDLEPIILNQASSEIPEQVLSSEKARRVLGWRPEFSLDEGLSQAVGWYRKHFLGADFEQHYVAAGT